MIRGAIFDLDGVLLDSLSIWYALGARYLRARGLRPEPELGQILFPMSMEQGADYLRTQYHLPESREEILAAFRALLQEYYFYEVPAKKGAAELLALLQSEGAALAAATSSPREHVTQALERLGLLPYLQGLFTTSEVGESKHSPRIYLLAAGALGCVPEETLVLEDSLYALQTAKRAGFRTVGVFDEAGEPAQDRLRAEADLYLTNLSDFAALRHMSAL